MFEALNLMDLCLADVCLSWCKRQIGAVLEYLGSVLRGSLGPTEYASLTSQSAMR